MFWAAVQMYFSSISCGSFWHMWNAAQACLSVSDGTIETKKKQNKECSIVMCHCRRWERPPRTSPQCSLVGVRPPRVWGHCGPATPPLSMASPAVAQDTVCAAAAFIVFFISLAFGRWFSELPGFLINTAALWRPSSQVLIVNCVTGPLHLLLGLPLPQLDCQAPPLLLGRRRCAGLNRLRYRLTWCPGNLRHPWSFFANANVS